MMSHTQGFAQSMGCSLLEPLLNEVVKREKSSDHCQAAITQLTRVGLRFMENGHLKGEFVVFSSPQSIGIN